MLLKANKKATTEGFASLQMKPGGLQPPATTVLEDI